MGSTRKKASGWAVLVGASLVLAACTGGGSGTDNTNTSNEPVTFTYAYEQEWQAYNSATVATNASQNAIPMNRVLLGFWYFAPDGSVAPETDFGTYEKVSDDPLTINYSFADDAVWSDGNPIDCDDAYLAWYSNTGKTKTFKTVSTDGYEDIKTVQCADGDKDFTVVYDKPYADWVANFGSILPAHVVEKQAGMDDLIAAIDDNDTKTLDAAGDFWTNGWVFKPGDLPDESLIPSSGPYKLSKWESGNSLTLVANDNYWGDAPLADTVVIRFIAATSQPQALENGEIQAMDPQPNPDLQKQLEKLGDSIVFASSDQFTWEHYDFNFDGAFGDKALREAFALCLPRQTIVDNLIKPDNPEAIVLNSRYFLPFQPDYQEVADAIAPEAYASQDIAQARQILEDNNAVGTQLRLGYIVPNDRRVAEAQLVMDACGPDGAGFNVVDEGDKTFFNAGGALVTGNFDVALFAWAGSPLVTGSSAIYVTDGGSNYGNYANKEVDSLVDTLNQTSDPEEQKQIIIEMETILWDDLATIPVFAFPGIVAYDADATGVEYNATQSGLTWNMQNWNIS
ncbi:MAG: ABC transporter family substrate-binding protein [Actinomycetia bacterium]|nr:ABC transporter family substrate-binding protein [Actinomycetes bacterium]